MPLRRLATAAAVALPCAAVSGCAPAGDPIHSIDIGAGDIADALAPLGEAIGDSRIVLLGENGHGPPARYYELRDEWMARAVAAIADSIAGPRMVVVWLHNDHARYGSVGTPSAPTDRPATTSVSGTAMMCSPSGSFSVGA